jgi:hypothetical protein
LFDSSHPSQRQANDIRYIRANNNIHYKQKNNNNKKNNNRHYNNNNNGNNKYGNNPKYNYSNPQREYQKNKSDADKSNNSYQNSIPDKLRLVCTHCEKTGHTDTACYKKHPNLRPMVPEKDSNSNEEQVD